MAYAKFDDRYDDHRKVKRAWKRHPRAVGLHAMAITYSARHQTDGVVDLEWLEEKLPHERERERVLAVLVEAGLFDLVDECRWRVHDFLDWNESASERRDRSERNRDAAGKRWGRAGRNADGTPDSNAECIAGSTADGIASGNASGNAPGYATPNAGSLAGGRATSRANTTPHHTAPHHTAPTPVPPRPPQGGRRADREAFEGELAVFAAEHFPGVEPGLVEHHASWLRLKGLEPTVEALRARLGEAA